MKMSAGDVSRLVSDIEGYLVPAVFALQSPAAGGEEDLQLFAQVFSNAIIDRLQS